MNSQNPNNEFSFPSEDLLDTSYSDDTNNFQSHNQNSVEYCTENTLENVVSPLENTSIFYQPVDDYSLYYIYSRGIQYLANLKQNEESNNASVMGGNPSNNQMNLIPPMLKSLNEAHRERSFGEHQKYPGISRYAGHLEALLWQGPRPHQIGNTAGGFNYKEEPILVYDAMEINNKFHTKSSTTNVLLQPSYNKDDLKEVTRDEYCNALKCKSKGIFKGTSTQLGLSRFSPKQSDYEKWKAVLLNSQNYKDSPATDIPSIGLNGNGKWMQTNNNFIKQAVENYWISSQLSQGSRNRDVRANPSFNCSTGSGEMTGKCNIDSENVVLLYCGENIFPGTWEEFGSVRLVDNDFYIVPVPQNEVVGIPDHTKSCTKQVIDIGFGEKADGFISGGNLDSNSTINESSQINGLSCMENLEQVTNPEYGDLEFFKQVQDEFTCSSSNWTDNMLLPPGFLGHDE